MNITLSAFVGYMTICPLTSTRQPAVLGLYGGYIPDGPVGGLAGAAPFNGPRMSAYRPWLVAHHLCLQQHHDLHRKVGSYGHWKVEKKNSVYRSSHTKENCRADR